MAITVRDALQLKEFQPCRLIAGEKGLNRTITCIDHMEVPDIFPWLKKEELLVTTAYAMKDDQEGILRLLEELEKRGAAGLAVKTRFLGSITENVKEEADRLKIPLIEIPQEIGFIDLTNSLMKLLVDDRNQKLEFAREMNEQFLNLQMEGGGIHNICRTLMQLTDCQILLTNREGEELFQSSGWKDAYCMLKEQKTGKLYSQEIKIKENIYGYLSGIGKKQQFDDLGKIAFGQAAVFLAVEFSKEYLEKEKEYHQDICFFQELLSEEGMEEDDALKRAEQLGWADIPYRIAVIESCKMSREEEIEEFVFRIREKIKKTGEWILVLKKENGICCLFQGNRSLKEIENGITRLMESREIFGDSAVFAGISREILQLSKARHSCRECEDAIRIGKKRKERINFIEELELEEVYLKLSRLEVLQKFLDSCFGKLQEYDRQHRSHLTETAVVLARNLGEKQETAKELFLHRNSLSYRIGQIEQIIGYDFSDKDRLLQLKLASEILAYRKEEE